MQYSVSKSELIIGVQRRLESIWTLVSSRQDVGFNHEFMEGKSTIILLFNIVATTCYNKLTVFSVLSNDRSSSCDYFEANCSIISSTSQTKKILFLLERGSSILYVVQSSR